MFGWRDADSSGLECENEQKPNDDLKNGVILMSACLLTLLMFGAAADR
jgi:hypothetical protein